MLHSETAADYITYCRQEVLEWQRLIDRGRALVDAKPELEEILIMDQHWLELAIRRLNLARMGQYE